MLLIVETITWKPHIETAMEIALRRKESGEEVVYSNLRRQLPVCEDVSWLHGMLDLPEIRVDRARKLLEARHVRFLRPEYSREQLQSAMAEARALIGSCKSMEDVKKLRYGDYFDLGWGVISSIVTLTRNSNASLASHKRTFEKYCASAILVYDQVCALIDSMHPTEVLLFNGRFATTRAAMRAAQSRRIPWKIHERGGNKDRYLVADCMPHDMDRVQEKMLASWHADQVDDSHAFFQARRNRIERDWHSFTHGQHVGRLPDAMNGGGDWVTFFTSSEDEMFAIGDSYANERFPTQMDAIRAVAASVDAIGGTRLCIRVHPHIAQKSRSDQRKWTDLGLPNAVVLGPEDPSDSYALIERSRVVCTYGSTIGIEATYWRRPSLLFARSFYDRIGVCEMAVDSAQVEAFLRDPKVYPQENTFPYGAYFERLGEPYRYYQADDLHRGRICGVYLDDNPTVRAARLLLKPMMRALGRSR